MSASPRLPSSERAIAAALAGFARAGEVARLHVAEGAATTPPPLAHLVHFPRLYVALAGRDAMWLENGGVACRLQLRRGDAVLVPANCWTRPVGDGRALALNVLFGRRQIGLSLVARERGCTDGEQVRKAVLPPDHEPAARAAMHGLLALSGPARRAAPRLADALLRIVQGALAGAPAAPRRKAAGLHESIRMFVQEHFSRPLNRDTVAAQFGITPGHLSRLFLREGMVTFGDYVTYARINHAKFLLRSHQLAIGEVATRCGFSDTGYFCRVFKKTVGRTASAYRSLATAARVGRRRAVA